MYPPILVNYMYIVHIMIQRICTLLCFLLSKTRLFSFWVKRSGHHRHIGFVWGWGGGDFALI